MGKTISMVQMARAFNKSMSFDSKVMKFLNKDFVLPKHLNFDEFVSKMEQFIENNFANNTADKKAFLDTLLKMSIDTDLSLKLEELTRLPLNADLKAKITARMTDYKKFLEKELQPAAKAVLESPVWAKLEAIEKKNNPAKKVAEPAAEIAA